MKSARIALFGILGLLAAFYAGCSDTAPSGPEAGLGGVTIAKYVAIGNSLSAGYQSNGLYQSAQEYSFPNLIAKQLQSAGAALGTFQQPLYSDPGTPDASGKASRYEIISMVGPVIGPLGLTAGAPVNLTLARPYDNLGIPGAVIYDFLDTTNFLLKAGPPRNNPLFALVLRQSALGSNVLAQAVALHPDLVTFWLGNNDVLGFATSGGASPSAPTSPGTFAFLYSQSLAALRAALPNAKIVVANIPDVRAIPFFTTIGPKVAPSIPAAYILRYQKHGNTSFSMDSTRLTEANAPMLTLTGSAYAPLLGRPTGKWYNNNPNVYHGVIPPGIDTTKPFGFHPQNPWPDALVLDADEQATAAAAVSAFNATIAIVAAAQNAAVVDINGFFASVKAGGFRVAGQTFTSDYVSGGLFSLDGVHPSSRGAGVVANQFIDVINKKFGTSIPMVDVAAIPGIPAPVSKRGDREIPVIPADAFGTLDMLWGAGY
jgi:hypothetical protein